MQFSSTNLTEFASQLGLSASTVSRVLAGKGDAYRIAKKTQERVLIAARESGFVINQIARGLRMQRTNTIGIVVPDIGNPFFASLASGIERRAREQGYSILLTNSEEDADVEIKSVQLMLGRDVDGMIVAPVSDESAHLIAAARAAKRMVLVDRARSDLGIPTVVTDNHGGGGLAVQHLAGFGHQRIVCLQGAPTNEANRERVRGFMDGLVALGLPHGNDQILGGIYSAEGGYDAMLEALERQPRPTAVVALGNLIALGALRALRKAQMSVPEDISLISYDEQPWAEVISPPLTTIAQPIEELGKNAFDLLLYSLPTIGNSATRLVLPVSLIARKSVAAPPRS